MFAIRSGWLLIGTLGLAISTLTSSGCSDGAGGIAGTVPVTGKVTYQGQPVADATVSFYGDTDGVRPASGRTGSDGSYSLRTLETEGALPGKYTVLVTKTEAMAGSTTTQSMEDAAKNTAKAAAPKQLLPAKYGDASQSPLKVEVKSGSNVIDLPLED